MGLFSFVGKALGKVAKAGLSVATKGVSDKVFSALKQVGQAKQAKKAAAANLITNQRYAAAVKMNPNVSAGRTLGAALQVRGAKDARSRSAPKKRRPHIGLYQDEAYELPDLVVSARRTRKRKGAKVKRAKGVKRSGARRGPPKGGLDMKAMSRAWRAAGSPGSWQGWIKNNPRFSK